MNRNAAFTYISHSLIGRYFYYYYLLLLEIVGENLKFRLCLCGVNKEEEEEEEWKNAVET